MAEEIERVNYYQLQYLGAEDFKAEQAYHRDMRRRHNVGHHLWGIVTGLEIVEIAKGNGTGYDVYVQPGFAIDGFGREIIVTAPHKLDAVDFRGFKGPEAPHEVWIAYREQLDTPPAAGYEVCGDDEQNKRVREEFRIVIDPKPPTHPPIIVGGKTAVRKTGAAPGAPVVIPDDESVPYQDFPADRERWLIRLGNATWNPATQLFGQTNDALRGQGRMYTGAVAENLLSPAAQLFLRPRNFTTGSEDNADFARIQGRLQVDGRIVAKNSIFLHGGRLWLQRPQGDDGNVPVWLRRKEPEAQIGVDLRVNIGPKTTPPGEKPHRLSIGVDSDDPAKAKTILAVRSDDNVDIATGKLNFHVDDQTLRQIVNFRNEDFGIGVQKPGLLYHRTASSYAWYRGGQHENEERKPGLGGKLVMELDASNKLTVHGPIEADSITAPTVTANDVKVKGGKVYLLDAAGLDDTDEISLARFHHGSDQNDLRVVIGDNAAGLDSFTVGTLSGTTYTTRFQVKNNGETSVDGNLRLPAGRRIHIGTMQLGGNFPVDVYIARYFINVINDTGVYPANNLPPIQIMSRMPVVSSANVHVALSYISNAGTAVNAAWQVYATSVSVTGNVVSFRIGYRVTDSDGYLGSATAIIVMVP